MHRGMGAGECSVEWHDFNLRPDLDWSAAFHPQSVEICLNLEGRGEVEAPDAALCLGPMTAGYYLRGSTPLRGCRKGGDRHRFLTIELSGRFLRRHLTLGVPGMDPRVERFVFGGRGAPAAVSGVRPLLPHQTRMAAQLQAPPVPESARPLWYRAKALEIASELLFSPHEEGELFCHRQQRLNRDRAERVLAILAADPASPPGLEELGRRIGCSHFYLSRTFTAVMGKTISACLRDLRMELAAKLLREGRMNVTEVALAVGYSSPSHFSTAFHETYGCCPGLYPFPKGGRGEACKTPGGSS